MLLEIQKKALAIWKIKRSVSYIYKNTDFSFNFRYGKISSTMCASCSDKKSDDDTILYSTYLNEKIVMLIFFLILLCAIY